VIGTQGLTVRNVPVQFGRQLNWFDTALSPQSLVLFQGGYPDQGQL
jgi:hypothetical protein